MCIAQCADIFGSGLVAGVFFVGTFAVHPAAATLEPSSHIRLRQELIRRLAKFMPPLMFLPVVACIGALAFCRTSVSWPIDALGGGLSLITIAITTMVNVPRNLRFSRWDPDELPRDWQSHVANWNTAHLVRMATALVAFVCAILAAI